MKEPLPWPITAIFSVVVTISFLAAELLNYGLSQTGQQVLSTLASIQAAIFAIVFSIVILGIQLSTSRYSTRLADLFRSDGAYKKTVGIFAVSLGTDIASLLVFTHVSSYILRFLISFAVGLSAASFVVLYFFVDSVLEQTTPEGIINRVRQELTPDQILSDVHAAANDPAATDPFLVPESIIRSTIDDRDLPAAIRGLKMIDSQVKDLLQYISTDQIQEETPVGTSLEELCLKRLPRTGEKSVEADLGDVGSEIVETLSSIGSNAVNHRHGPVALYVFQGLARMISDLDFDATSEMVRKEAMDASGELLTRAAEAELWDATGTGVRRLGWRAAQSVVRRSSTEGYNFTYTLLAIRYIPTILEEVVKGVSDTIDEKEIIIGLIVRDGEHASPSEEWALWCCYAAMTEVTSAFIRYELNYGETIVDWRSAASGWASCITTLYDSDFDLLLRYWLGAFLYLDYIRFEIDNQYMSNFQSSVRYDIPGAIVEQTIDDILNNKMDPTSRINLLPGRGDPVEHPRTGYPSSPVSNPDRSFKEWLEIRKGSHQSMSEGWRIDTETAEEDEE